LTLGASWRDGEADLFLSACRCDGEADLFLSACRRDGEADLFLGASRRDGEADLFLSASRRDGEADIEESRASFDTWAKGGVEIPCEFSLRFTHGPAQSAHSGSVWLLVDDGR
jgi:hypothetical protein